METVKEDDNKKREKKKLVRVNKQQLCDKEQI